MVSNGRSDDPDADLQALVELNYYERRIQATEGKGNSINNENVALMIAKSKRYLDRASRLQEPAKRCLWLHGSTSRL